MDSDGDTPKLSELRIVLMGYRGAGKSSSGNIILNREEFDLKRTAQCVKRQREVADRHITVIEAPGWWWNEPLECCFKLLKQEILGSVSLCLPGPHILLLVISVGDRFRLKNRIVLQGYVELLGERVWSHTIVLFTHGDFLGDTSIEQHIEREGEDLQWLVEKCGNRYHVLNNNNSSDDTQIKHLLEKIEETVMENNGCHFDTEKIFQEMEKMRAEKGRVKEQMKMMQKLRYHNPSQIRESHHLTEPRTKLIGLKGADSTSAENIILDIKVPLNINAQCLLQQKKVDDRNITVVNNLQKEGTKGLLKIMRKSTKNTLPIRHTGTIHIIKHAVDPLRSKSLILPPEMSGDKRSTAASLYGSSGPFRSDQLGESLLKDSVSSMSSGYGSSSSISESVENVCPTIKISVCNSLEHSEQVELRD